MTGKQRKREGKTKGHRSDLNPGWLPYDIWSPAHPSKLNRRLDSCLFLSHNLHHGCIYMHAVDCYHGHLWVTSLWPVKKTINEKDEEFGFFTVKIMERGRKRECFKIKIMKWNFTGFFFSFRSMFCFTAFQVLHLIFNLLWIM